MGRYDDEIKALREFFRQRLELVESFQMTEEDYAKGIDQLPAHLKDLTEEAFTYWLTERKYELSYNQVSRAFFCAAADAKKITLTHRHPDFRLGSSVFIKEVWFGGPYDNDDCVENIPGTIASIHGDDYVVVGDVGVGDANAKKWSIVVPFKKLERRLTKVIEKQLNPR